jgi:hypothetical protein
MHICLPCNAVSFIVSCTVVFWTAFCVCYDCACLALLHRSWFCVEVLIPLYYHMCNLIEYKLCIVVLLLMLNSVAPLFTYPQKSSVSRSSVTQTANGDPLSLVRAPCFLPHFALSSDPEGSTVTSLTLGEG